jgi:hypothetical protein
MPRRSRAENNFTRRDEKTNLNDIRCLKWHSPNVKRHHLYRDVVLAITCLKTRSGIFGLNGTRDCGDME